MNTPDNWHALGAVDILEVLTHGLLHKVNILGDMYMSDHRQRIIRIFMESHEVVVVSNDTQGIIIDASQDHRPAPQLT